MSLNRPTSLRDLLARFTLGALLLFVGSLSAGAVAMWRTWQSWEQSVGDRSSHWASATLDRRAADMREAAVERAFSDEALEVISQRDSATAWRRFLGEERAMLDRRGLNVMILFDARRQWRYVWRAGDAVISPSELPPEILDRAENEGGAGGYLRVGTTVYRVGASPIWDSARRQAAGFIVLGSLVTPQFLSEQSRGLDLPIHLSVELPPYPSNASTVRGDSLVLRLPLAGVSGAPIGAVRVALDRRTERAHLWWGFVLFAVVLVGGVVASSLTWFWGQRLLVRPLRETARELEAMSKVEDTRELATDLPVAEWESLRAAFNAAVRARTEFQRRYRDVFDRAADAIFLVEKGTGRVVDANPATATLTGVAASEMIGRQLPTELVQSGPGQRIVRWRRADGVTQTWGVVVSELAGDGGALLLAVYRDLTGREAMAHAQKMEAVGSLAGGIAHDFNNLMAAVLTGVTAARSLVGAAHPAVAALDGIQHAGTRAAELTRQLLNFSRHDPPRLEPVDLRRSIETVAAICTRTFDPRIAVTTSTPADLPAVLGDAGELEQALLNLCINARDAMPRGGSLRIDSQRRVLDADEARADGLAEAGTYVEVSVADNGTGMTDEVKARLFEPFFTTKEPGRGTGLGLSLVYGLTRQLGGAISVQSTVGHGTRVRLLFPAHLERAGATLALPEPDAVPAPPLRRETADGEKPLILLVDDERALREMLRMVLDLSGFDVVEAADGTRALSQFGAHRARIRCVLLDVQLPGDLSGVDALERIRAVDPRMPVLLCTGFVREEDLVRMRQLGATDVLQKPLDIQQLLARLDAICGTTSAVGAP